MDGWVCVCEQVDGCVGGWVEVSSRGYLYFCIHLMILAAQVHCRTLQYIVTCRSSTCSACFSSMTSIQYIQIIQSTQQPVCQVSLLNSQYRPSFPIEVIICQCCMFLHFRNFCLDLAWMPKISNAYILWDFAWFQCPWFLETFWKTVWNPSHPARNACPRWRLQTLSARHNI